MSSDGAHLNADFAVFSPSERRTDAAASREPSVLLDLAVGLSRAEARRKVVPFVSRYPADETSAPTAAQLMKSADDHQKSVVPMLVLAANAATTREELDVQAAIVEAWIESLRHGLYSVLSMQRDLKFHKFSTFPTEE